MSVIAKDSLYSSQKTQGLLALGYQEEIRQNEAEAQRENARRHRRDDIQYAAMAIGIIVLLLCILLLSRSVIVNEKWVSFLSILGLLVVFEFINLILHPALETFTGHSPALMLVALVAIAAILIPLHHRLERRIRLRMIEKNKLVRLAAARRTIQQLEGNTAE